MKRKVPKRVIITDGFWRKSLSAVRSLGKEGFHVSVMGDSLFTTSFWSKFTNERIIAPLASTDPEAFGQALLNHLKSSPETILLPMEDATLSWVVMNKEKLKELNCHFLVPEQKSLQIALDKARTLDKARELKIPFPKTLKPEAAEIFAEKFTKLPPGEFIAKPRIGAGSKGLLYIPKQSTTEWENHWNQFGPMLIQERIPSHGIAYGVSLLMDQKGECVAQFVHQRRQQYPPSGGPSTDRQSVQAPELVQMSIQLLKSLKWKGVAMVEWKTDPRDKITKLMEINPRFWGSLELAVRSGMNFPKLYVQAALGEKLDHHVDYKLGVRSRWLIPGDFLRYLKQSQMERESLRRFFKGLPTHADEWDPLDIHGFFASIFCTGAKMARSRFSKLLK